MVTADARRPIAMFGYDGAGPSHLLRLDDSNIWEIDAGAQIPGTMKMLQEEVEKLLGRTAAEAMPRRVASSGRSARIITVKPPLNSTAPFHSAHHQQPPLTRIIMLTHTRIHRSWSLSVERTHE